MSLVHDDPFAYGELLDALRKDLQLDPTTDILQYAITDGNVAPANIDGTAATPSLRTLGTGAQQAMPGSTTPSWTGLSYATNYANPAGLQAGQWWKDPFGFIRVRGWTKKTTAWVNAETIATLPVGARPGATESFLCEASDATAGAFAAAVTITSAGVMQIVDITPAIGAPAALSFLAFGTIQFQQVN